MCRHTDLPPADRQLSIDLFVATHELPPPFPITLDEEKYQIVKTERELIQSALKELEDASIDAPLYRND